jgi:hypothetical protein
MIGEDELWCVLQLLDLAEDAQLLRLAIHIMKLLLTIHFAS